MNPNSRLREGIDALQEAPVRGKEKTMQAIRSHSHKTPTWRLAGLTATVGVLAITGAILLWPKPSLAAELQLIKRADLGTESVIERNWVAGPDGQLELYCQTIRLKGGYKSTFKDAATQYFDGKRLINEFKGYAIVQDRAPKSLPKPINSIDQLLTLEGVRNWTLQRNASTEIGTVNRYVIDWNTAGRSGKIELLADPATNRPLRQLGIGGHSTGFKFEWDYRPVQAEEIAFRPKAGLPVYDIEAQRREFLEVLANARGTEDAPEIVAAYVDEAGLGVVFTVGDDGFPADSTLAPVVGGRSGEFTSIPWGRADATRQYGVVRNDRTITAHAFKMEGKVSETALVEAEVYARGGIKKVKKSLPIRRTGSLLYLLTPQNVPFFEEASEDGSTKGG